MNRTATILLMAIVLSCCVSCVDAQPSNQVSIEEPVGGGGGAANRERSWPQWMGANWDGVSDETGWSDDWPDSGLSIAWSRDIGIGFSSVAVANGRLFTMGHIDGMEYVHCLDALTGEQLWRHQYPCKLIDNLYEGGPGSTPTINECRVYTLGKEGQLFCFQTATGEVIWQRDLQTELDVRTPEWGFNGSAYIMDDELLFEAGRVASFNKFNGEKNWQGTKHAAGYGSVAVLPHDGKRLLATLDCDALRITDSSDGRELDSFPWKSPFRTNSTTPIVSDGTIYVSTGYQVGCGLFQLKGDRLDLIYSNRDMRNHFNNSILLDGYLYGFDGNSNLGRVVHLVCMKHETGEVMWRQRGFGCGSLIIADGKLLILSDSGTLVLAEASADGFHELARSPLLEGRCWTMPVLVGGRVYARNAAGRIVCALLPKAE